MPARFSNDGRNFAPGSRLKLGSVGLQNDAVTPLSKIRVLLWLSLCVLLAAAAQAQQASGLPTGVADSRTLKVQRKVDDLFERGEYERAFFIYRNELVPLGDKYAQYMVGFMHLTGKGVDEDPIAASAWYRLAAERGTPEFVAVRDFLIAGMTPDQRARSDAEFLQIRHEYSDLAVLLASIKRDARELEPMTGSRIMGETSPLTVIEASSANQSRSSTTYRRRVNKKLEGHLVRLAEIGNFPNLETDPSRFDIEEVERLVNERLQATPD